MGHIDSRSFSQAVISVVIPVYNSDKNLKELYKRLTQTFGAKLRAFHIIFVEDCVGNHSW